MNFSFGLTLFILSIALIVIIQRIFLKYQITDKINDRSSHSVSATRSGGLAIFTSVFFFSIVNYINGNTLFDYSIIVPLALLITVGCYDDIFRVDFKLKFIFQIIAAKMIIDTGLLIDNFHGILGIFEINRLFAQLFTMFIIVSIINAINFIDGIDGLAISVVTIFLILFEFLSISKTPFYNLSFSLVICLIPLYYFNFRNKNKVFLGDSGSHFLGGVISILTIYCLSNSYVIMNDFDMHKIIFVFSILSYPIVDLLRVVFYRLRNGRSPFLADKNHIHHLLLKKNKSHKLTTIFISLMTIAIFILIQVLF